MYLKNNPYLRNKEINLLLLLFLGVLIAITVDIVIVVKKRSANADVRDTTDPTPTAHPKDDP